MTAPAPTHARGPRGDYHVGRGDLTGRRAQIAQEDAKERQATIDHSIHQMSDPDVPLTITPIPGASAFALPTYAYDAIRRAAR